MTQDTLPKFDITQVDENEHLIPRPFGTLQTLNLDHLYRYAFAKGFCYGAVVLDAAMGCGYASLILNPKQYIGVDIDPNMVAFANEHYKPKIPNASYLQGSVLDLPLDNHSVDVFISFETIEHIQVHEVPKYFQEVKRVVKPGGMFLCSTPIYRGDDFGLLTRYHPYEFRYGQFEAMLTNNGLAIQETLYQWPPHFTLQQVVPSFAQTQQRAPFIVVCACRV
jgi:ubiquinone/menaquinone biosynthesis C-methylase UbiE